MEDMCQLTERLAEHKYNGSYEQIGRAILKFSGNPGFDLLTLLEVLLFSFLTGNNDMQRFSAILPAWSALIDTSFVSETMKLRYKELIQSRANRLFSHVSCL
jgi:hypothetical protein